MSRQNKLQYRYALTVAFTMLAGIYLGTKLQKNLQPRNASQNDKITELIRLIKNNYVDDINVDSIVSLKDSLFNYKIDSIRENELEYLLNNLDPHSIYLPPAQLKQSNEDIKGEFAGIGVEYSILKDTVIATYVLPDGPASKGGLQVGDQLIKVNDSSITGVNIGFEKLRSYIRGEENTEVKINILRNKSSQNILIKRGIVALPSLDATFMISPNTGYIKLSKFSLTSYTEFRKALIDLKSKGMQQLIFDLRGNGGGIMGDAVNILDEFISGRELLTYTKGAKQKRQDYYTSIIGNFEQGKLVVLIDENSASASEVVAGALQDLERATIIGRRSYGKGLVQRQFGFTDKSALRLTIARYYTPSGRCIQKPYTTDKKEYRKDLENRFKNSELTIEDSIKNNQTEIFKTKSGKIVYGGGGISPDIFVGIDTNHFNYKALNTLLEKNAITNFSVDFYLKQLPFFKSFKNPTDYNKNFSITPAYWQLFDQFVKKDSINIKSLQNAEKEFISQRIKSSIARFIWRNNGLYEVLAENDKVIKKAVEICSK